MKIVIKIDEKDYQSLNDGHISFNVLDVIMKGIILPKGHGRLIDESDLMPDSDYEDGMFYAVSIGAINGAPTIIEADKEESEVDEE